MIMSQSEAQAVSVACDFCAEFGSLPEISSIRVEVDSNTNLQCVLENKKWAPMGKYHCCPICQPILFERSTVITTKPPLRFLATQHGTFEYSRIDGDVEDWVLLTEEGYARHKQVSACNN